VPQKKLMQPVIESTTQHAIKPLPLRGLGLRRAALLNQTEPSPSKTFKFTEKYMEQLKEGHAELLKETSEQLWRKEGIPRYIQSLFLKDC